MRYAITSLRDRAALAALLPEWEDLAAHALEPNVFHEPWMLRPALEAFAAPFAVQLVLVRAEAPGRAPLLCGVFPLERATRIRGLPYRHLRLWRHKQCLFGAPLVRAGHAHETFEALFEWLARDPRGASALEWSVMPGEGELRRALGEVLQRRGHAHFVLEQHLRALLQPRASAEAYLAETLSRNARQKFRRLERRLAERGALRCTEAGAPEAKDALEAFLALEASGWKGERGSALGSSAAGRSYFLGAAAEAARRGRLMLLALELDGRPVAMKCNFLAREGAFAFKIAYDERFAHYSPGALLELENIRRFHQRPGLRWMDSCAAADYFQTNRLWLERRPIETCLTATGRAPGELVVSALPLLRWAYRRVRRAA